MHLENGLKREVSLWLTNTHLPCVSLVCERFAAVAASLKCHFQLLEASLITNGSLKVVPNVKIVCVSCTNATDLLKYLSKGSDC